MNLFISYAHKDIKLVKRLITSFEQAGHDVWYDSALKGGQSWQQQLEDEIANCDVFVYVMTPNSAWDVSEWCHWEFVTAVEQHKPVLPLLVKSVKLPVVISRLQYVDLTQGLKKNTITQMLADLNALRVLDTRNLPAKPRQLPENPERMVIKQTMTASGNARINNVGQQNNQHQTTIHNSSSNTMVFGIFGVVVIVALIAIVIVVALPNLTGASAQSVTATDRPTETLTPTESFTNTPIATPATPFVMSDEETPIRTGPGVRFEILTMWDGRALDILGRSADGGWYHVRLRDGSVGWVVNSQTVVDVSGNLGIIPTIVVTHTPTDLPTDTPLPSLTPSNTPIATLTYTPTLTQTPSHTPVPSDTPAIPPTATLTPTPSQCTGKIPGAGGMINQVKVLPNPSSPARAPVQRGAVVVILDMVNDFGTTWYQIQYGDNSGWISEDYVDVPMNCS